MIKEAIDRVLQLAAPTQFTYGERSYTDKNLVAIQEPQLNTFKVFTLAGFGELVREKIDSLDPANYVIHVEDFDSVNLTARKSDVWGRRSDLITASPVKVDGFKFGNYQEQDNFIVGVLSGFAQTDDRDYVVRVASSLTANAATIAEDDGIAQKVTTQRGVTLQKNEVLKNRVVLAPYRTFPEVDQTAFAAEFIFRVRNTGDKQIPNLALFEADGGKWKVNAINEVRRYLATLDLGVAIIA